MKQKDIKTGRFYQNKKGTRVRYVEDILVSTWGDNQIWWTRIGIPGQGQKKGRSSLRLFARWADTEVMPVYDTVVRCPYCDAWDWWGDVSTTEVCYRCEKTYKPKA